MTDHSPVWEGLRSGVAGLIGGGAGWRYLRILVRDMPDPEPNDSRFYAYFVRVARDAFDAAHPAEGGKG